jgi:hypothetical protein
MKKIFVLSILLIVTLLLTACSGPNKAASESDSQMQTEIVMLLTSMVTETATPEATATSTPEPATPTPKDTMIPVVLVSPTESMPTLNITPSEPTYELITFTPTKESGTKENISTKEATPEPPVNDPAEGLGDPTYEDDFATGDNWSLGRDKYMDLRASNGNLIMRGLSTTSGWRITRSSLANGYIQLSGEMSDCSGADNFGLYFRVPNATTASSGYLFGISCDGKFALRKWNGETMTSLIYWKENATIKKGSDEINTLGVMLDGYEIKLYINGKQVGKTTDDDYGIGSIGIYVAAKDSGDVTVLLHNLSVWKK